MSEASTQKWAKQTLETIEDHWACHRASDPELSGAQVNFLIEMQRAAERYLRYCDDVEADKLEGMWR